MEKKKKLIHRIGAFVCALVLSVSVLCASVPYYASELAFPSVDSKSSFDSSVYSQEAFERINSSNSYAIVSALGKVCLLVGTDIYIYNGELYLGGSISDYCYVCRVTDENLWRSYSQGEGGYFYKKVGKYLKWEELVTDDEYHDYEILYISKDIYNGEELVYKAGWQVENEPSYNSDLGYLQNISRNIVFDEVPLGENVNEKYTERWYYDQYTTTGVDLTSGDYFIRYYQERWIVTGYDKEDIVDKGNRYLLGDYLVQNGYIETYSEDIESTLAGQGYEEPSFFDLWFNKFVTMHYYFQVVNAKTGEVGGLVHVYLTDDNGSFGVDLIAETTDLDGNVDDDGYSDFIEEDKITTDDTDAGFEELENNNEQTIEEWLENLQSENESINGSVDGSDDLLNVLVGSGNSVNPVSIAVGKVFALFPPQVLLQYGIAVALIFVAIVYRALRG